jgi:hypothetical protein
MSRTSFFLAAGAAAAVGFSVSGDARALGPIDVELGAIAGGGTRPTSHGSAALIGGDGVAAPNILGFGLGGSAGLAFHGFYVGVEGMYYVGGSTGSPYNVTTNSDLLGVDVGYGFTLAPVTIRPVVGIGNFTERANGIPLPAGPATTGGGVPTGPGSPSASDNTLYIQPGITGLVSLGTQYYVGADANVLILTSLPETISGSAGNDRYVALTFHAQVGARF